MGNKGEQKKFECAKRRTRTFAIGLCANSQSYLTITRT